MRRLITGKGFGALLMILTLYSLGQSGGVFELTTWMERALAAYQGVRDLIFDLVEGLVPIPDWSLSGMSRDWITAWLVILLPMISVGFKDDFGRPLVLSITGLFMLLAMVVTAIRQNNPSSTGLALIQIEMLLMLAFGFVLVFPLVFARENRVRATVFAASELALAMAVIASLALTGISPIAT
ncbi:MAG: hypothetical protein AAGI89_11950 [Pseudomonadota bacterium]